MSEQRWQANLQSGLADSLDEGELRAACFDVGIDYDRLSGASRADRLKALIEFCHRHKITCQFLDAARTRHPDIKFPDIPVDDHERWARLELRVKSDIISFGNFRRAELIQTIAELFDIEQDDIHVLMESTDGPFVNLVLGMPRKDADRLARPHEIDKRFTQLEKDYQVQVIQSYRGEPKHWHKLSLWQSHRVHGIMRLLAYLGGFIVFVIFGTQLARMLVGAGIDQKVNLLPRSLLALLAILPGWFAWIGLLAILARFMRTIYTIGDSRETFDYFFLCVFGPLAFRYPFIFIQEGQVAPKSKTMPQGNPDGPGGPCLFIVFNDSAIVTERGGRRIAVKGPQVYTAGRFEKIYQVLDLRPQTRTVEAKVITRDGIPLKVHIGATFRIRWKGEPSAKYPHPADPDALLQASAAEAFFGIGPTREIRTWADRVGGNLDIVLRDVIARYRLDELLEARDPGVHAHSDLMHNLRDALGGMANNFGAEITEVRLEPFEVDTDLLPLKGDFSSVREQRIDSWRASWEGQVKVRTAQAQASAIRMREMAQSYAQLELITALTREVKPTSDDSIPLDLIALRFVEVISRMAANPEAAIYLPHEALQTLDGVRKMLQEASSKPDASKKDKQDEGS